MEHGLRAAGQPPRSVVRVEVQRHRVDLAEDGHGSAANDAVRRGDERQRRDENFVTIDRPEE
jgi:hypothetical protein